MRQYVHFFLNMNNFQTIKNNYIRTCKPVTTLKKKRKDFMNNNQVLYNFLPAEKKKK